MPDALFVRAGHAIAESRALREQHRRVTGRYEEAVKDLRLAIMDSAMLRLEIRRIGTTRNPSLVFAKARNRSRAGTFMIWPTSTAIVNVRTQRRARLMH